MNNYRLTNRKVDDKSKQVSDGFWANVYYDVVPVFCSTCFHLGHSVAGCKRGSNGRVSMVQVYDSQVFDNLPKPTSDSAQVVFDKMLQNTGLDTTDSKTTDSKTLQRTNNSCRQITLGLHDQQSTTSCQGPAASRKLSASESKMVSNVVNMSEVHLSTVDNGLQGTNASIVQVDVQKTTQQVSAAVDPVLQGPPDVHIVVQNSFGILNSEGLDYESNLQQMEGDVAVELKRQPACMGVNVAEFAAAQAEAGVADFPGDHAARILVQSQGSKPQDLAVQVNSYPCRQHPTDGVTARLAAAPQFHYSGQNNSCNSETQPSILSTGCHSSTRSNSKKDTDSAAIGQAGTGAASVTADTVSVQSQGSTVHQMPAPLNNLRDAGNLKINQPSWAQLVEQEELKVISRLKSSEVAAYAQKQIDMIMQEGTENGYKTPIKSCSKAFTMDLPDLQLDPWLDCTRGGDAMRMRMSTVLEDNYMLVARRSVSPKGRSSRKLKSLRHKVDTLDLLDDQADLVDREVYSELGHELQCGDIYDLSY